MGESNNNSNLGKHETLIDNERVRVTEWTFNVGQETGFHTHEFDYVVVPILNGDLKIVDNNNNISISSLKEGKSYFREKGVSHNVINNNDFQFKFVEIELK